MWMLLIKMGFQVNICDIIEHQKRTEGSQESSFLHRIFQPRVVFLLSALHCAASRGHSHCIEELKKLGADVNLADKNSCTPLFYAVTLGNKDCTKTLLKHGADPNHKDVRGRTWDIYLQKTNHIMHGLYDLSIIIYPFENNILTDNCWCSLTLYWHSMRN